MRAIRWSTAVASLVVLSMWTGPTSAGTPESPEFTDVAGDANGINGQGIAPGFEEGPDTRPASADGADLRKVWFETPYVTTKERDEAGKIVAVRHTATGVKVHIETTEAAIPTFGPTLLYRVPVQIGSCTTIFQMWVRGEVTTPLDPPNDRADLRRVGCGFGPASITSGSFHLTFSESVATLEYPFTALQAAFVSDVRDGAELGEAETGASVRTLATLLSGSTTQPPQLVIDETEPGRGFTIGSDVPADVDCLETPEHPECVA